MKSDRPTIRDIAAMAGVSAGTVSRAMNGLPGVGADTRRRISEIIAEQGFRVDATARQLSTGRSNTLGVLFPLHASEVVMHPIYPELLGALGDAAERAGYDILLLTMSRDQPAHVRDTVVRRRVDGVVMPAAGPRDPLLRQLTDLGAPVVLIGHRSRLPSVGWVDCTHDTAAREVTRMMLDAGRRDLVLMNGPVHVSACKLRSAGFWAEVTEAGPAVASAREVSVPFDTAAATAEALTLLSGDSPPDAIVCASDTIAAGVLDAARSLGLSVPDDLAVSGFDDSPFGALTQPTLTTVRMPLHDIGRAAAEMLFAMIDQRPTSRRVVLPTEVVVRASTSPAFMPPAP
ncbi:LacI family DNA-binding transcriptional regulator [Paractinoplanes globisporus]|uniref:LacI family DNA-binding transcriptional regulator n=1 Tax=Paractinoplanes globisporus TaxID=113565 RepID=A0ABW6WL51_9ACTN|nr:LacI family DNA-binding transcriptional regulator [Actinoplanes globisporus]